MIANRRSNIIWGHRQTTTPSYSAIGSSLPQMRKGLAFAVPYSWILANKQNLNMTDKGERSYWHVALTTLENGGLAINTSRIGIKTSLEPYRFSLDQDPSINPLY